MHEQSAEAMVPVWAMTLTAQVAEIKAKTDTIPALQHTVEEMRLGAVSVRDHEELRARLGALWDAHNPRAGELTARRRPEAAWRAALTIGFTTLTLSAPAPSPC